VKRASASRDHGRSLVFVLDNEQSHAQNPDASISMAFPLNVSCHRPKVRGVNRE
jgi:hypothetical protein